MTRERLTFGNGVRRPVMPAGAIATAAALAHEPEPVKLSRLDTWDWGWGGLLIFTVLLFFRPQDQFPGLQDSHISDIAALIGLCALFANNLARGRAITRMTPELLGVLGFGLVIVLTIPTSIWPTGAFGEFQKYYLPIALIYLLMVNTVTTPKRIERIVWIIVLAFGFWSARVLIDHYFRGVWQGDGRVRAPVGGFFQNPNDLALNLAAFLPFAFMYIKRPGPGLKRLMCAGIAFMMLVVLVLTKSRGGTLGFVAMLATFLIVARVLTPTMIIAGILSRDSHPAGTAGLLLVAHVEHHRRAEGRHRLARGTSPAADSGLAGVRRTAVDGRRRRPVQELLASRPGEEVARNAQRAAAGGLGDGCLRVDHLLLPDLAGVLGRVLDAQASRMDPSSAAEAQADGRAGGRTGRGRTHVPAHARHRHGGLHDGLVRLCAVCLSGDELDVLLRAGAVRLCPGGRQGAGGCIRQSEEAGHAGGVGSMTLLRSLRRLDDAMLPRGRVRHVLIDGRTAMNFEMVAPVVHALASDDRIQFACTASEEPHRISAIYAHAPDTVRP